MSFRILLVEDNLGDQLLIKMHFKNAKIICDIDIVDNGQKAIDFLNKAHPYEDKCLPHLILLDLNLPVKSGFEVLEYVRNHDKFKYLDIIVLTTSSADEDFFKSRDLGISAYISKFADVDQYLNLVLMLDDCWFKLVKIPKLPCCVKDNDNDNS